MRFGIHGPRAGLRGGALLVAAVLSHAHVSPAPAQVHARTPQPIAPRGGVMMLPLDASRLTGSWPTSLTLTLADGATVTGAVVWIRPALPDDAGPRHWTTPAVRPVIFTAREGEAAPTPATHGAPYLVTRLPRNGAGPIQFGEQTLQPIWRDPTRRYALAPRPGPARPSLMRTLAPDRPDPDSPFEHWRWVLLADRLDLRPPTADHFGDPASLVARHYADLWRIGLGHLGEHSLATATACRDFLTRVIADPPVRFAAWVAEPSELDTLLTELLDFRKSPAALVRDVRAWMETRRPMAAWAEADEGHRVRIAIGNRSLRAQVARLSWSDDPGAVQNCELPPGELVRVWVDRTSAPTPVALAAPPDPNPRTLLIRTGTQIIRLRFGPATPVARPPGAMLPPFRPPLTLMEIETEHVRPLPPDRATYAQLRRRVGRWEMFFEMRRVATPASVRKRDAAAITDIDSLRGLEAVTLFIGPEDAPRIVLVLPETGAPRFLAGVDDGTLEVHRNSYADRWYCRVVVPEAWLDDPATRDLPHVPNRIRIGGLRTHGDTNAAETTPGTSVPWNQTPARAVVGIEGWE